MTPQRPARAATVRRGAPEDLPALLSLRAAWRESPSSDAFVADFTAWFEREATTRWWWIAEDAAGTAVGMVNLKLFDRMPSPGRDRSRWGYLANLYVRPSSRNAGLGTRLVTALLDTAVEEGLARVVLSPSEASLPLYRRLGFADADMLLVWQPPAQQADEPLRPHRP